ncbi:WbqC family protein [Rhizobium viscosum]|uniref:WbqC family protein n=1 Tax=Rhizobium viscosum TaxID=1673 RepID=A0ABR9IZT5_RHIVS|nr:WbqC family protein [Rhizobium viscosum]MBE1508583.1 hypothetical protein [Rhizobium viscosum]
MKLGIMQPYFLPYIGYYQLIAAVDTFIIYDNIKYTKKGWINRNRFLRNNTDAVFSIPLKKASDSTFVVQRELADDFDRGAMLNQFKGAYRNAPYFRETWPLIEHIVQHPENNLFLYIKHSIAETCAHLGIETDIRVSSEIDVDHGLKAQDKVIALCRSVGADEYINAIGGLELYDKGEFRAHGVDLKFIKAKPFEYSQFGAPFVPWLSIVDVLMFNQRDAVRSCITSNYELG